MLGHFSVYVICLNKVLFRCVNTRHAGGVLVANSTTCFDIFSGFHGDTVPCKGHDEFSVGFLELIILNRADICLVFHLVYP